MQQASHLAGTPHLSLCPKGSSPEPVPGAVLRAWDSTLSTELPSADAAWQWGRGGSKCHASSFLGQHRCVLPCLAGSPVGLNPSCPDQYLLNNPSPVCFLAGFPSLSCLLLYWAFQNHLLLKSLSQDWHLGDPGL